VIHPCERGWSRRSILSKRRVGRRHEGNLPGMPDLPLAGGSHSQVVRVGSTIRRASHPWSVAVLELLGHLDHEGFGGAPRALGIDDHRREILTYIEGQVAHGGRFIPDQGGRFDLRLPDCVWRDDVLALLRVLMHQYHDAATTFRLAWSSVDA
jgi:hypothetical protein